MATRGTIAQEDSFLTQLPTPTPVNNNGTNNTIQSTPSSETTPTSYIQSGSPLGLTDTSKVSYDTTDGSYQSLFNGSKFYYRPTVSSDEQSDKNGTNSDGTTVTSSNPNKSKVNVRNSKLHDSGSEDDLYDISTNSIINYTNNVDLKSMKLTPSDFAYLKDFGVYPNNRLIVTRRFQIPVENDLTAVKHAPISTIVSWIPDSNAEFFKFKSSEDWSLNTESTDPMKDLSGLFNDMIGKVMPGTIGGGLSSFAKTAANLMPFGGIAEAMEQTITNYLLGEDGKNGTNFTYDNIVTGNPNYMAQSSYRKINSINSEISIPVKCVYEMKYINNIDPTIVSMDIIQNILRFSSSQSVFYISQTGGGKINEFFNKFKNGEWISAMAVIVDGIINAVQTLVENLKPIISDTAEKVITAAKGFISGDSNVTQDLKDDLTKGLRVIGSSALSRYRIEFSKIIPSATGVSSAPWHVTIGNPKNPFFSSGDMIVDPGEVKFGNTLGFNDLPTRIEFSFNLKSARSLGIQEIFDKFNIGAGRQYQRNTIKFVTDFYQGSVNKPLNVTSGQNSGGSIPPSN